MNTNIPPPAAASIDVAELDAAISRATSALLDRRRDDGHWCFELEADATIPAEYVLMRHFRGEPVDVELERKIAAGSVFAISLEPEGGSPTGAPTGPVVAAGGLATI